MSLPLVAEKPWDLHTIDDSSLGADGIRLADVNGDGLMTLLPDGRKAEFFALTFTRV